MYTNFSTNYTSYPTKVLTFDLPSENSDPLSAVDAIIVDFVQKLAEFLSATVSTYNYSSHWAESHPYGAPANLQDLVGPT